MTGRASAAMPPGHDRPALDRPPTEPCMVLLRPIGERRCKAYVRVDSDPMLVATVAWHEE